MRNHEGYIEMTPEMTPIPKEPEKQAQPIMVVPKRGRPRKG
jgi:hypothetical protein